jgi:hypothetical protein
MTTPVDKQPITLEIEDEEYEEENYDDYEDDIYEDEDEDTEDLERRVAWDNWSLPDYLSLKNEAADFYILYAMKLDGVDEGRFDNECLPRLAKLFSSYADMVVGGELRYSCSQVYNYRECLHPKIYKFRWTREARRLGKVGRC